jgi:ATP-dependent RNA helicase DeaD
MNSNNGFQNFTLPTFLQNSLEQLGFAEPTKIQADTIPHALEGSDILAMSKTGSGKTLAFCLPVIAKIANNPDAIGLIMTPTREIAIQVSKVVFGLIEKGKINIALLIGGEPMPRQFDQLKRNPRLIIGTPGRLNDHLARKKLRLENVAITVLDEADRMLDMGFDVQIEEIFKHIPNESQKLMFSATMPKKIQKLSEKYLKNPAIISTNKTDEERYEELKAVRQEFFHLANAIEKYNRLLDEINQRNGTIVIFAKTKSMVDQIANSLQEENHSVDCIHGDLKQTVRAKVISKFRDQKYRILVATDVVARGLDVPHVEHVINFDMPMAFEEYIHRIGRTNRQSGLEGSILNFITQNDIPIAVEIKEKLGHHTAVPAGYQDRRQGGGQSNGRRRSFGGNRNEGRGGGRDRDYNRDERGGNGGGDGHYRKKSGFFGGRSDKGGERKGSSGNSGKSKGRFW